MMGSSELIVVVFDWVSFVAMVPQYVYRYSAELSAELVQLRRHEEDRQRLLELMAQLCRNSGGLY
ncbi:uncharacterized protein ACA1_043330 [Acanthamoeba castellanii str. Neff]|uniref:Uncharacterized protein n=1 Tax=Acanthamoeba castellanii (strain ATCC 30010 / Neff) TaxID=1257118 RepID=L8GVE9_ACACF|nr:uncharacterized protein ACA1_043330 [Acanthamoeba castellanii str. Neff]ELR16922.1 hypothetical protein ACA1_043330 [Acanthamoeba castellanii str. Neff]